MLKFYRRRHILESVYIAEMYIFKDFKFLSLGHWMNLAVMISKFLNFCSSFISVSYITLSCRRIPTNYWRSLIRFSFARGCSRLALNILVPPWVRQLNCWMKQFPLLLVSQFINISSSRIVWDSMINKSSSRCHLMLKLL